MKSRYGALLIVLLLSGCAATQIHSYNSALVDLHAAKSRAEADNNSMQLETAKSGLANLADEAAANAAKQTEVANKISLYRIAGTAAWQSGEGGVQQLIAEGVKLCRVDANAAKAPRDCGMLIVVPVFAAVELTTSSYNATLTKVRATPAAQRESLYGKKTQAIFGDFYDATILLINNRALVDGFGASPGFYTVLDQNMKTLFNSTAKAHELVRLTYNPGEVENETACRVETLQDAASAANIPPATYVMLNSSDCQN